MIRLLIFFLTAHLSIQANIDAPPQQEPSNKQPEAHSESIEKNTLPISTKKVSGKDEIHIGCSLPLTGGDHATAANQISDGMTLFFNKMLKDAKGPSFTCALKTLDDADQVLKLGQNVTELLKGSPLLISPYGTDTMTALVPNIKNHTTLVLFPLEGSEAFRKKELDNLIFFRASFAQELQALITYAIKTLGKKKIALFYEASDWGEGVLKDAEKALGMHGLKLFASSSYPQNSLNIIQGAEALVQKAPQAILCIASSRPAYNFIRHIINRGLHQTVFLGLTALTSIQETLAKSRGINIITSSVVPDPTNSTTKIAQEFRADMQKFYPNKPLSPFTFEGYINAALLVEGLKQAKSPLSPESIMNVFTGLTHVKFKDIVLKFNAETRSLSDNVWLNFGDGKEWRLVEKKSVKKEEKKSKKTSKKGVSASAQVTMADRPPRNPLNEKKT